MVGQDLSDAGQCPVTVLVNVVLHHRVLQKLGNANINWLLKLIMTGWRTRKLRDFVGPLSDTTKLPFSSCLCHSEGSRESNREVIINRTVGVWVVLAVTSEMQKSGDRNKMLHIPRGVSRRSLADKTLNKSWFDYNQHKLRQTQQTHAVLRTAALTDGQTARPRHNR
jgi:hypothetical protein